MTRKTLLLSAVAAALLAGSSGTAAVSHDDDDDRDHKRSSRRLKADLSGFNEVLTVSTRARGSFRAVLQNDETQISYRLRFQGLSSAVTQAHIHFGDHHMNGGISVWLCGTATNPGPTGTPMCAPEVEATVDAQDVTGPAVQGIAAGEFAELVRAIKAGRTYVNVHSTMFPGGEIRGQIKVDD
jgi:hypothetical protein